jgi:hypothetical protein
MEHGNAHPNPGLAIAAALVELGVSRKYDQAAIVGEAPPVWSRVCRGHRSPSAEKLQAWTKAAEASGYALGIGVTPHGWDAVAYELEEVST